MDLVARRPDICWGIIGPWGHHYPDLGEPGPAVGFQDIALAWWNHWLKPDGRKLDWPHLRMWRRQFDPPRDRILRRSGSWIQCNEFRSSDALKLFIGVDGLRSDPDGTETFFELPEDIRHGECAGDTGYFGRPGGLPLDQGPDDARSLCFDSAPLRKDLDITGCTELSLTILRDSLDGQLVCRICDITPDNQSNLVTRQIYSLAKCENRGRGPNRATGRRVRFRLRMPATAYRFAKGNRIRLALGTSYWPLVWPSHRPGHNRISTLNASLTLPVPVTTSCPPDIFPRPRELPARPSWQARDDLPFERRGRKTQDGWLIDSWRQPPVMVRFESVGVGIGVGTTVDYRIRTSDPCTAVYRVEFSMNIERGDGIARLRSKLYATQFRGELALHATLQVQWNGNRVTRKDWQFTYRDGYCEARNRSVDISSDEEAQP